MGAPKQHMLLRLNTFLAMTQSEISRDSFPAAGFYSQIVHASLLFLEHLEVCKVDWILEFGSV